MTWFKVDDGFWSHPKTLALSDSAVALWTRAGSYCGKHLTDGLVERRVLPLLQGAEDAAEELVEAGLWHACDVGWEFHDWTEYQDTRETVERRRAAWKDRQRRHRGQPVDNSLDSAVNDDSVSVPFLSKGTRDSRRDTPRDSTRDSLRDSRRESRRDTYRDTPRDKPTPTPPPLHVVMAELEAKVNGTEEVPF